MLEIRIPSTTTTAVVMADPTPSWVPRKNQQACNDDAFRRTRSRTHAVSEASRFQPCAPKKSGRFNDGDGKNGASHAVRSGRARHEDDADDPKSDDGNHLVSPFVLCPAVVRIAMRSAPARFHQISDERNLQLTVTSPVGCGRVVAGRTAVGATTHSVPRSPQPRMERTRGDVDQNGQSPRSRTRHLAQCAGRSEIASAPGSPEGVDDHGDVLIPNSSTPLPRSADPVTSR